MMRALITGITGFAGSHLADCLLTQKNIEVFGITRWRSRTENIDHLKGKVTLAECDLRDPFSVREVLRKTRPERVYHLAAQSYVPMSWVAPSETLTTNLIGEVNLFEALRQEAMLDTRVQLACSSEEYGQVLPGEIPIKETNPLRPLSPYGVSKVAQDYLGYQYHKSYRMFIVRTRGFNHTGPRRGEVFVTSNFARQIAEIEKKKKEPVIYTGNLEAVRDFTDVRDTVRGYYLSLEKGEPGEVYNVCSGKGHKVREVLDILLSFSKIKITTQQDPKRMRPSDVELLVGDPSKFEKQTGWKPTIPFEQTLEDLLNYWRERI
jgi:GDP-4-dehydro-6-deoxy-D-mannose reductase